VKRGDKIKIYGILHYVGQNNPFLANSRRGSNDIIHKLKIQMKYHCEPNSLKPKLNEDNNSVPFFYMTIIHMFEEKLMCTIYCNLYGIY